MHKRFHIDVRIFIMYYEYVITGVFCEKSVSSVDSGMVFHSRSVIRPPGN